MAYVTYDDIMASEKIPETVDLSSKQSMIAREIASREAYVNRRLAKVVMVPIDKAASPELYAIVQGIVIDLVVSTVVFASREAAADGEEALWYPTQLRDEAMAMLDQLCDGQLAAEGSTESESSLPTDGLSDSTASAPMFTVGKAW